MKKFTFLAVCGGWFLVIGICLIGCDSRPRPVPVSGLVTIGGKPAFDCQVRFEVISDDVYPPPSAAAMTDSEGKFTLKTVEPNRRTGAIPGKYRVYCEWLCLNPPEGKEPEQVPKPYKLPIKSLDGSIEFIVPPKGTHEANFEF
ncbi:MAG: hypothetical protein ACRCUY_04090 [Thermoguttaceae bacterium]